MLKRRDRKIEIIRRRLLQKSLPRIQVSLILSLTALAGFLTSFLLLHLGVPWMWLRYPLAISTAYVVFLLLLALWLWLQRGNLDPDLSELNYIPDASGAVDSPQFGGGGDFSGGGAGGGWGSSVSTAPSGGSSDTAVSDIGGWSLDLDEGWLVVIALVVLVGGLIASFYIIYIAPALLAEILVDGVLVAGLYKRVKRIEQRHWLRAAVRRTLLPAFLVALCFTIAGYALQIAVPEAHTLGEVWDHAVR